MISVCMATYNGLPFIIRQVASIIEQLDDTDELVIADDGSTDDTIAYLRQLGDRRIRIIDGAHRHSPIWNFEKVLGAAKGDYIFLTDQDDVWMPDKLSVSMTYLKQYDCVVSDCCTINAEERIIEDSFYHLNGTRPGRFYNLFVKNGYLGCCMAFNRRVLETALPFPSDVPMHDIWIGNVAAFKYSVCFIPEKLMQYRRHGKNASTASSPSAYGMFERLRFRWVVVRALLRLLINKSDA